jgi:Tfp pilus assembly protein PilF
VIEQILQADRYLQVDQVERARDAYQKVVDLDPGNAMAVVGLARCALADGDDREAHALASRALRIDPEDDMARRMEARLSEILITRGETVERPLATATPGPREMRPLVTDEGRADGMPATAPEPANAGGGRPRPDPSAPAKARERVVRRSLVDRLLGR